MLLCQGGASGFQFNTGDVTNHSAHGIGGPDGGIAIGCADFQDLLRTHKANKAADSGPILSQRCKRSLYWASSCYHCWYRCCNCCCNELFSSCCCGLLELVAEKITYRFGAHAFKQGRLLFIGIGIVGFGF